jgi:hypothetical protein
MTTADANRPTVLVYDPVADESRDQDALGLRLASLDGKVIGLLDNTKDLVNVLLGEVQDLLQREYPKAQFRYFRKESVSGASAALLEQVAECDAVITAVGD